MKRVTAAIIGRDGKFLIVRRKQGQKLSGYWEFPGGKIEEGETPEDCLKRELKEELGVEAEIGPLLGQNTFTYDHGKILLLAYETRIPAGEITLTVHDAAEWVPPAEFSNYKLAPADIPIANNIAGE